jgi:hypothetical protein
MIIDSGLVTGSLQVIGNSTITGSLSVDGSVTATSFVKEGGTSSEYLMADGSTSEGGTGGGGEPSARVEENFIATAGQTVFPITYEIGQIDVYYNGLKLYPDEFTANNGTTVVLEEGATLDSQVSIVKYVSATTSTAVRNEVVFEATADQNTFLVDYTVGQIDVFHNGAKLNPEEFTATNGTSVVLGFDCLEGASVTMLVYLSEVSGASGTSNKIAKFTGAATLGDSQIYDDGTNVGIGKDSSNAKLDINGNTVVTGSLRVTQGITGSLFGTATSASYAPISTNITNNVNNFILTATGGETINGESGLQFDGVRFSVTSSDGRVSTLNDFGQHFIQSVAANGDWKRLTIQSDGLDLRAANGAFPAALSIASNGNATFNNRVAASSFTGSFTGSLFGTASFVNVAGLGGFVQGGNSFGAQALIGTNDNQPLALETSGSIRMFVANSGNVGIGTTSPIRRLEVASDGVNWISGTFSGTGNANKVVIGNLTNPTIGGHNAALNAWTDFTVAGDSIIFSPFGTERMRINGSGNVGIGTTDIGTDFKLAINGGNGTTSGPLLVFQNTGTGTGNGNGFIVGNYPLDAFLWNYENANMIFGTNNTERIRITSGGDVCIGATSTINARMHVVNKSGGFAISVRDVQYSTQLIQLYGGNANVVGSITTNGEIAFFNTTSDYRLKHDLKLFNGLDLISKVRVYDYKWKESTERSYGVMAHELQEIIPSIVTGEKDGKEIQSVDYSKLIPILIKGMQEQQAQIKELQDEIISLKNN